MYFEILDGVIMRLRMMNISLINDLEYYQFGPSNLGIYILVPELLKITIWSLCRFRQN